MVMRSIVQVVQIATVIGSQAMMIGNWKYPTTAIAAMTPMQTQFNRTSSRRRCGVRHELRSPSVRDSCFS